MIKEEIKELLVEEGEYDQLESNQEDQICQ